MAKLWCKQVIPGQPIDGGMMNTKVVGLVIQALEPEPLSWMLLFLLTTPFPKLIMVLPGMVIIISTFTNKIRMEPIPKLKMLKWVRVLEVQLFMLVISLLVIRPPNIVQMVQLGPIYQRVPVLMDIMLRYHIQIISIFALTVLLIPLLSWMAFIKMVMEILCPKLRKPNHIKRKRV